MLDESDEVDPWLRAVSAGSGTEVERYFLPEVQRIR